MSLLGPPAMSCRGGGGWAWAPEGRHTGSCQLHHPPVGWFSGQTVPSHPLCPLCSCTGPTQTSITHKTFLVNPIFKEASGRWPEGEWGRGLLSLAHWGCGKMNLLDKRSWGENPPTPGAVSPRVPQGFLHSLWAPAQALGAPATVQPYLAYPLPSQHPSLCSLVAWDL